MFLGLPCVERHAKQNAEGLFDVRVTVVLAAAMADLSTETVHFRWTLEGMRRRKGPVRASQTRWYVAMQDAVAMTTGPRGFVRFTSGSGATDGTIDSDGTRDGDGGKIQGPPPVPTTAFGRVSSRWISLLRCHLQFRRG